MPTAGLAMECKLSVENTKLEAEVKNVVENNRGVSVNALMGIIMGRFRGKVSGGEVAKLLKKHMK